MTWCIVGGYILTPDQVLQWCRRHNIDDPKPASTTLIINCWLRERKIRTRLLAVTLRKEDLYLVVTARRSDVNATKEDSHAHSVNAQIDMGHV